MNQAPLKLPDTLTHQIHEKILRTLQDLRFATTKQLARLTSADYGNDRSALRQTMRHLKTLAEHDLVRSLERRVGGWEGGSQNTIWALTTRGHRLLTDSPARQRPHLISTTFLEHLLAVAETRVIITETANAHAGITATVTGEPGCWRQHLGHHGQMLTLKPDLHLTIQSPEFRDSYFLEVDRATENPKRVVTTCWSYQHYRLTGAEQKSAGVFPAVIWIVPNVKRREQLRRHLNEEPRLPQELFTVITLEELPELLRNGPPSATQQV